MQTVLQETAVHGDRAFPFALYHMHRYKQTCSFSLHWHPEVELIYIQQGVLNLTIDKTAYQGYPGDVFVVNSREIHKMSVTQTPTVYMTVLFPLETLLFQQADAIADHYLRPLAEGRLRFPSQIPAEAAPAMAQKLEEIAALFHKKQGCYMLKIRILVLSLLVDCFEHDLLLTSSRSRYQDRHREILGYINANYHQELTLEDTAAQFHMVPKYFSRYFKTTFHLSFTDYVNQLRLEEAADLLRHSELPVTEIAIRTGFNSSSYFNKKFRALYKKTPSEYRRIR